MSVSGVLYGADAEAARGLVPVVRWEALAGVGGRRPPPYADIGALVEAAGHVVDDRKMMRRTVDVPQLDRRLSDWVATLGFFAGAALSACAAYLSTPILRDSTEEEISRAIHLGVIGIVLSALAGLALFVRGARIPAGIFVAAAAATALPLMLVTPSHSDLAAF